MLEKFNLFANSLSGRLTGAVVLLILVFGFISLLKSRKALSARTLAYSAIAIAIATVLSNIKLFPMPQGGTVTAFSMIFVSMIGYWFGLWPGLIAAVSYGILQLIIDPYVIHPAQLLLDYPLAFGALGLSGIFSNSKNGLSKGYVLGVFGRFVMSTLSGVIFFREFAEGNAVIYSSVYNLSYMLPEMIMSLILIQIPAFKNAINSVKEMASLNLAN